MSKRIDKRIFLVVIFLVIVLFISIGYSAFSSEINIFAMAEVQGYDDIRITGISVDSSNLAYANSENISPDSVDVSFKLTDINSYLKYKINLINFGNVEVGILKISGLPSDLSMEIDNYQIKDKICDDDDNTLCKLGVEKEIYITIRNKDIGSVSSDLHNVNLGFDFEPYYNVYYPSSVDSSSLPSIVMGNDRFSVKLFDTKKDILVRMAGVSLVEEIDYTYSEDGVLTINKILGNIGISTNNEYASENLDFEDLVGVTGCGLTVKALGNGIYTIDGVKSGSTNCFFRISDNLAFATSKDNLGTSDTIIPAGEKVKFMVDYLEGSCSVTDREGLKINLLDSSNEELVMPHYDFYAPNQSPSVLTKNVTMVTLYSAKGKSLSCNNLKFRLRLTEGGYVVTENFIEEKVYTDNTGGSFVLSKYENGLYVANGVVPSKKTDIYFDLEDDNFSYNTDKIKLVKGYQNATPKYKKDDNYTLVYEPLDNIPWDDTIREVSIGFRVKSGTMLDIPKISTDLRITITGNKFRVNEPVTSTGSLSADAVILTAYFSLQPGAQLDNYTFRIIKTKN